MSGIRVCLGVQCKFFSVMSLSPPTGPALYGWLQTHYTLDLPNVLTSLYNIVIVDSWPSPKSAVINQTWPRHLS